ncbi:hypothetical protein OEIGOIKO_03881 [Streptomyces chrestomyceticus JCM 4735]|uniref:Uncharacterized protein n=1 Tax=Streptomyces chrestomyceticus JCM 4735 TaxID=1306181 RepID=A0A7U9KY50_9ACTN|nr:hypothetical protein [Streptomyces chrestomyceticus]GCD36126.1 hypothetical protein OEIGOIKO_03881 [Streptomyces chrestomyceticus JCM 4735]
MSEGESAEQLGNRAARIAVSVVCAVLVVGLALLLAWWLGLWAPGFAWLSTKLAVKAAVFGPIALAGLLTWRRKCL